MSTLTMTENGIPNKPEAKNGLTLNGDVILFSRMKLKEKRDFFVRNADFIVGLSEFSHTPESGFTPRTPQEIERELWAGSGDMIISKKGEPISILLAVEVFGDKVQDTFLDILGYPEQALPDKFPTKIYEIAMAYTNPMYRGQGYYSTLKTHIFKTLERRAEDEGNTEVLFTVSSSAHPAPAITSARSGMAPINFERNPLASTLVCFSPDDNTPKEIPDYEDIKWLSSEEVATMIRVLSERVATSKGDLSEAYQNLFGNITVFASVDKPRELAVTLERFRTINPELMVNIYREVANSGSNLLGTLERYIFDMIAESPKFNEFKESPKFLEMLGKANTMILEGRSGGIQDVTLLVLQQFLVEVLRELNDAIRSKGGSNGGH